MNALIDDTLDDEYDDFVGDDDWEDIEAAEDVKAKYPGWFLVKMTNFTSTKYEEIKEWCETNCTGSWERVGWYSGCSYTVGVILEDHVDAVLFRLTWEN
jgi:hypothetical protein